MADIQNVCVYCLPDVVGGLDKLGNTNTCVYVVIPRGNTPYMCDACKRAFDMCEATVEVHAMRVSINPSRQHSYTLGECKWIVEQTSTPTEPSQLDDFGCIRSPRDFDVHNNATREIQRKRWNHRQLKGNDE